MCIYDSIWVPKGIVKLSFEILLTTYINSRAYYETCHVGRIAIFDLKPLEIQSSASPVFRKGDPVSHIIHVHMIHTKPCHIRAL